MCAAQSVTLTRCAAFFIIVYSLFYFHLVFTIFIVTSLPRVQMDVDEDAQSLPWSHGGAIIPHEDPHVEQGPHGVSEFDGNRLYLQSSVPAAEAAWFARQLEAERQREWSMQRLAADADAKAAAVSKRQRHVELLAAQLPLYNDDVRAAELAVADAAQMMRSRVRIPFGCRVIYFFFCRKCILASTSCPCARVPVCCSQASDGAAELAVEHRVGANGAVVWRDASFSRPLDAANVDAEWQCRLTAFDTERRRGALPDVDMVCATAHCFCLACACVCAHGYSLFARFRVSPAGRACKSCSARFERRCRSASGPRHECGAVSVAVQRRGRAGSQGGPGARVACCVRVPWYTCSRVIVLPPRALSRRSTPTFSRPSMSRSRPPLRPRRKSRRRRSVSSMRAPMPFVEWRRT